MTPVDATASAGLPPLPAIPKPGPPVSLGRILLSLLLFVVAFDVCFWEVRGIGLSFGVFGVILASSVGVCRRGFPLRRSTVVIGLLLAGACFAAALESGATNILVVIGLSIALAGDSFFDGDTPPWARWFSAVVAMAFSIERPLWLAGQLLRASFHGGRRGVGRVLGGLLLLVPALALALVFGGLLASGNAVFASWTGNFFDGLEKLLDRLFELPRILVWLLAALLALPLLRPLQVGSLWWSWLPKIPRLPAVVPAGGAVFGSAAILIVLNGLFAVANVADAIFLWSGARLPAGVTYSAFVHHGVNTLIFTVILSSVVLVGLFQQETPVARRPVLKALGLLWIAQNLFVLMSVLQRLLRYIEAYDLTESPVGVILFLLLVSAGFGFLAVKILREKSLPWLVGRCAAAVFVLFYAAQFLNTKGWVADFNVARWEADRTRNFDLNYLRELGPAAWPAYRRYFDDRNEPAVWPVQSRGWACDPIMFVRFDSAHWREFSLRAYWNRGLVEPGE